MDMSSTIDWVVGMPIVILILAVSLWWLFGRNDKGFCPKCSAPRIFGDKCIICEKVSKGVKHK
ncbi:hypothetical protein K0U27_01860 [archaeon]|nr:hypothetical protein [archaeon]